MKIHLIALTVVGLLFAATSVIAQESQAYRPGNGVSAPKLVKQVKPTYTPEARAAKIQGTVLLSTVVLEDGTVGNVKVSRSLDTKYGLDNEAIKAAKQWTFTPGMKDGKPVAVSVTIEISFTL
jgi:protein TonB